MNKKAVLIGGYGYWDVTYYPYGGDFHRSQKDLSVNIIEDLGGKYGYKAEYIDSLFKKHIIVTIYDAFILSE